MTQREIAKKLNISPATLSLVLNNKPGLSTSMRERVITGLQSIGQGALLKSIDSIINKNVAFIVFQRSGHILDQSPFFSLITESMYSYAQTLGYNMIMAFFDVREETEHQIAWLRTLSCAGAIVFATEMLNEDLKYFSALPYPCVFMDNFFENRNVDSVAVDNSMGTFQLLEYLTSMGHQKIGYLKSSNFIHSFYERDMGFISACLHFGAKFKSDWIFELPFSVEAAEKEMLHHLKNNKILPTAFVSDDDIIAIGAIRALESAGYTIPKDFSIVGFSNRPTSEYGVVSLTTIDIKASFGSTAIKQLLSRIESKILTPDEMVSVKSRIGTKLVVRDSVAAIS